METDEALRAALKRAAAALKAANVPFALSGGYASWARGGPHREHDVDFVLPPDAVPHARRVLQDAGFRAVQPPEDWLEKVVDGDAVVDLIFRPAERPVTEEQLGRATEMSVDSVVMPVQSATDLLIGKLLVLDEQNCDFARLFPHVRALREQVDWPMLRREVAPSPFARVFLTLCAELDIVPDRPEEPR